MSSRCLELADVAPDRAARLRVEADGRLVEEQHARRVHQARGRSPGAASCRRRRCRRGSRAAPTARPSPAPAASAARSSRGARRRARRAGAGSARPSGSRRAWCPGRPARCCAARRRARRRRRGRRPAPAAGRVDERAEHLDRRRLAGAVGAEEAEDLAARDLEVDPAHGFDLAVALGEASSTGRCAGRACRELAAAPSR